MAGKRDYYEVLGVERDATAKKIADAYRKLAMKYHPDRNPGDEETVVRFKEAAEAFEVLNDGDKRARYDRFGHAGVNQGGGPQFSDLNDIFSAFGDIFGDGPFSELFGGGGRRGGGRRVHRGGDVQCELTLDLFEAARGATKTIKIKRHAKCETCQGSGAKTGSKPEKCQYCNGAGQVIQSSGFFRVQTTCPACKGQGVVIKDPCRDCRGGGFLDTTVDKEVPVPAGMDNGMGIRLTGEGHPSPDGGPPGDCICQIHVKEHPLFQRDGQNLICRIPISYSQAALGAKIEVPTLDGKEELDLPHGTQSNDEFKLRGKGMPDPRGRRRGDLLVRVTIETPKKLTKKQEELLRQLAEEEHANVSPHRKSFFEKLKDYFVPEDTATKSKD